MTSFIGPDTVRRSILPNGLTVLVRRDTSAPVVAIVTHVKAGYFDETDNVSGIAHVLEHMFFKGTARRGVGEIAKQTKESGGYLNAHTIYDATAYSTVLPSARFAEGLDIQADAYANSAIDAVELERELEVIVQEAKRKTDSPQAVTVEALYELLHDEHRIRRWRIGHESGLRQLNRASLMRFYTNFYRPSNTILAVVGDVEVDEAMARVSHHYGDLRDSAPERITGPIEPDRVEARYRELSGDVSQAQVAIGWRTANTLHEDTPALDLASHLLGAGRASRLYRGLRERELASSASAYNYTPTELGVFVIQAETRPERVVEAVRAAHEAVRGLREEIIDENELVRVRRILEARWVRRFETMEGQASYLADWEALGNWTMGDEYLERIMSVTASEVREVTTRYLTPDRAGTIVYRPAGFPLVAASAEDFFALVDSRDAERLEPLPSRSAPRGSRKGDSPALEAIEAGVHVFRTRNGVPLLVLPRAGAAIAHLGVHAAGGARDEGQSNSGVTTLALRSTIKGTFTRTAAQIADDSEMLGGIISTGISSESFGWSMSVPVQHLASAIELLGDVSLNAVVPDEAVELERSVALSDLAALRDDMFRFPMRLLLSAAYEGHPYSMSSLGTEESLRALAAEDVRQWYRTRLLSSPIVAAVVGDVDPGDIAVLLEQQFGAIQPARPDTLSVPKWPVREIVRAEARDKAQTALAIGFPGPSRRDARRFAAHLTATIASGLGGRFFDELRDRQSLAYTVHAFASEREAGGMFLAYIATSPEKEDIARRGLLREFKRLRDEPVTPQELERAQTYSIGSHAIRRQSGGAVRDEMLDAWLFGSGLSELDEYDDRIAQVTAADIQNLAIEFFDPARRVEGVVRGGAGTA